MTDMAEKLPTGKNPDARKLWEQIFDEDTADFLDYYDEWKMAENTCYGIYREQKLVSMLQLNPYEMVWNGQVVPTAYIIAVATDPACRHQGLMTKLLKKSLGDLREKGAPFAFLMPADEAIYLPSGFRYFYYANMQVFGKEETSGQMSGSQISVAQTSACEVSSEWTLQPTSEEQLPEIIAWADRLLADQFEIYTKRDLHYWETLLAEVSCENGRILALRKGGEIRAVIPVWGWEETEIREILCRPEDRENVTAALNLYAETCGAARAEDSEAAAHRIAADGIPWETGQKKPVIMGRIVDAQSFLSLYNGKEEKVLLKLFDEFLPENGGFYDWQISENGSSARRITEEEAESFKKTHRVVEFTAPELFRQMTSHKRIFINEIV